MADKAMAKNQAHAWTQSAAAWAAFGNDDFERAFELSNRAVLISPEDSYVLDFHALVLVLSGQFENAREASDPARHVLRPYNASPTEICSESPIFILVDTTTR